MMFGRAIAALVALLLLAGPTAAESGPELLFIHKLDKAVRVKVGWSINALIFEDNLGSWRLDPGSHVVRITLANGQELSRGFQFSSTKLAGHRGGRFWCVVVDKAAGVTAEDIKLLEPKDCLERMKVIDATSR